MKPEKVEAGFLSALGTLGEGWRIKLLNLNRRKLTLATAILGVEPGCFLSSNNGRASDQLSGKGVYLSFIGGGAWRRNENKLTANRTGNAVSTDCDSRPMTRPDDTMCSPLLHQ